MRRLGDMNAKFFTAILGICVSVASVGAPIFSAMKDCPSIGAALDEDGRQYLDFGSDVRLRLTPDQRENEIALRGISAFETNESIYRSIEKGQAITLRAVDSAENKPVVEVYTREVNSKFEYVAVYHRERSAIVVSSFDGSEPMCEKLSNSSASEFISDLSRSNNASEAGLRFTSSQQVYARLGL